MPRLLSPPPSKPAFVMPSRIRRRLVNPIRRAIRRLLPHRQHDWPEPYVHSPSPADATPLFPTYDAEYLFGAPTTTTTASPPPPPYDPAYPYHQPSPSPRIPDEHAYPYAMPPPDMLLPYDAYNAFPLPPGPGGMGFPSLPVDGAAPSDLAPPDRWDLVADLLLTDPPRGLTGYATTVSICVAPPWLWAYREMRRRRRLLREEQAGGDDDEGEEEEEGDDWRGPWDWVYIEWEESESAVESGGRWAYG